MSENAQAVAIVTKIAFRIGTTIEYSNFDGSDFFVFVKTLLAPYSDFIKSIGMILCSLRWSACPTFFAAVSSLDARCPYENVIPYKS